MKGRTMSFTASIAVLILTTVLGLCLCQTYGGTDNGNGTGTGTGTGTGNGTGTGTGNGTDIQVFTEIKNCTQEAIYYTSAYLKYKCVFFNKQICFDNFEKCFNANGHSSKNASDICQQEIGPTFLSASNEDCDAPPSKYLQALQSTCCTKTKQVEQVPGRSFVETQNIIENCYDKVNCPDTGSCSEANNSPTNNGGNMGASGSPSNVQ